MCKSVEEDFAALRETKEKDDEEEEKFQVNSKNFFGLCLHYIYIVMYVPYNAHPCLSIVCAIIVSALQSEFGPRPESEVCSAMWKEMDNYHGYNLQAVSLLMYTCAPTLTLTQSSALPVMWCIVTLSPSSSSPPPPPLSLSLSLSPTQLKSNKELKAMFDHHYPNLVLLTSPLASLKASLPKMTLMDSETLHMHHSVLSYTYIPFALQGNVQHQHSAQH